MELRVLLLNSKQVSPSEIEIGYQKKKQIVFKTSHLKKYRPTGQGRRKGGPGEAINKFTFSKTVAFVLNFKLWPP